MRDFILIDFLIE